jgi:hypothetical protein
VIRFCVAATLAWSAIVAAQSQQFTPPRLLHANLPPLPSPNVLGGGEVLIEFIVDRTGAVTRPVIVRATPPYTQMLLETIAGWRFESARARDERGIETLVEAPVTVGAVYRPPTLVDAPVAGQPPTDVSRPSGDVAYPTLLVMPAYPPQALFSSVVLFEVNLSDSGAVVGARGLTSNPGFDSAARDALARWRFRPATYRARPVSSTAYAVFGFRSPVAGCQPPATCPTPVVPTPR